MQLTKEYIQKIKDIYEKESNEKLSDSEAREATQDLIGFAELCFDIWRREQLQKSKLKKSPKDEASNHSNTKS